MVTGCSPTGVVLPEPIAASGCNCCSAPPPAVAAAAKPGTVGKDGTVGNTPAVLAFAFGGLTAFAGEALATLAFALGGLLASVEAPGLDPTVPIDCRPNA